MIPAIETFYGGCHFRSRLEARWAIYFDAWGISWVYEPEGYKLTPSLWYLPDFLLPQVDMFAEVKPQTFSEDQLSKCELLARGTQKEVLLLDGVPDARSYFAVDPDGDFMDYVIDDRYLDEQRFFACTGASWPMPDRSLDYTHLNEAIFKSRRRF